MKSYRIIKFVLIFVLIAGSLIAGDDTPANSIILKAMKDELARNIYQLRLDNLASPFFISYKVRDGNAFEVKSTLGSTINSREYPVRNWNARVIVGSYQSNDENFFDFNSMMGGSSQNVSIPIKNDYDGIRRTFWLATDNIYKKAAEQYERKKAAMKQQAISKESAELADFSKATPVKSYTSLNKFNIDKKYWEGVANEISVLFRDHSEIYDSEVRVYFYQADEYQVNSEGTEIVEPLTLAAVQINAYTQASDGEELFDHILEYAFDPEGLPGKDILIRKVGTLIENIKKLREAPVFTGNYLGPVLFEGEAVPELFAQMFFRDFNGVLATRKPFVGDPNALAYASRQFGESLESKIDRRIISKNISITASPFQKKFSGIDLIGYSEIDAEGIRPKAHLVLVQNGILKTLLSNRTPTLAVSESNGHARPVIGSGSGSGIGPGVINVTCDDGMSPNQLRKELIQAVKDEGLEYGIIVRKIKSIVTGKTPGLDRIIIDGQNQRKKNLEKSIYVYKVYVKDGHEEMIRSAEIDDPSVSSLRHILGASKNQVFLNNLMPMNSQSASYSVDGIPASFITPSGLIIEELEVKKEKKNYTPKPPFVTSPLSLSK